MTRRALLLPLAVLAAALVALPAVAAGPGVELEGRAILPADASAPAEFPGIPNTDPYVTIESVLPLRGGRLAIVNDTNFGSRGRNPSLADYSDFIVVRVPDLRGE